MKIPITPAKFVYFVNFHSALDLSAALWYNISHVRRQQATVSPAEAHDKSIPRFQRSMFYCRDLRIGAFFIKNKPHP